MHSVHVSYESSPPPRGYPNVPTGYIALSGWGGEEKGH